MITFDNESRRFVLRIVGIAFSKGRVLLQRTEEGDFWALPGGRGEFGEPSRRTLDREMDEELRVSVDIGRLVWIVENFFSHDGKSWHDLDTLDSVPLFPTFLRKELRSPPHVTTHVVHTDPPG